MFAGIIGALLMSVVTVLVFAGMHLKLMNLKEQMSMNYQDDEEDIMEDMYILNRSIAAGDEIEETDITLVTVAQGVVPIDAIKSAHQIIGKRLKTDHSQFMPVTEGMVFTGDEISDDMRVEEFSLFFIPSKLQKQDYVDIRLSFPNGEDYIVLSKKQVQDLERDENTTIETIWLYLTEEEILRISSAIVDAYLNEGSNLYAITYVMPEIQEAAIVTYPVNGSVLQLMRENPNILFKAYESLELDKRLLLEKNLFQFNEDKRVTTISSISPNVEENRLENSPIDSRESSEETGFFREERE
jgi:hypothetical protein